MATPPPAEASRFYLRPHADPPEPWHEVSRAEYIQAERAAGFSAPSGLPATYAFGADYIEGCSRASGEPAPHLRQTSRQLPAHPVHSTLQPRAKEHPVSNPVPALLARWQAVRAEIRAIEEREHPPITDSYGRRWLWKDGDLYVHDNLLAFPKDMIPSLSLPRPGLAEDNPNYTNLCTICRHQPEGTPPDA